jgi:acetoin utilization protein AcuC
VNERASLVFDPALTEYDFGEAHPMSPLRVKLTMDLAKQLGVLGHLDITGARPLTNLELLEVHTPLYVERVEHLSAHPTHADLSIGLGGEDNPLFAGMHEASALIAGASVEAARQVWTGERLRAANIAGGLHHAMPGSASGFCIYNDIALAIRWMLNHGAERIAYIDIDAHHGDGVQAIFYHDPRVLTVSIHEHPQSLFPGTGYCTETGAKDAEGSAVNIPLPAGTSDAGWLRAFHAIVPDVVRAFKPQVIVSQHGCDSHIDDPLTNLMLSIDGQRIAHQRIADLADELTDGRWLAFGGGGYAVIDVVPRTWTHLLGILAHHPIDPQTPLPDAWRAEVERLRGQPAPEKMTDGRPAKFRPWEDGYDPDSWLDRAILATRNSVFPLFGIDPTL